MSSTGTMSVESAIGSIPPEVGEELCGKEPCEDGQKRRQPHGGQNVERVGGTERSAHACERGGQQLNGRRIQNDEQAQLIRCGTLAAAAHTAGGADAERRGRVAKAQKIGREVSGDRGQRLTVAARVRQEPLEQRAEEGSEAVGEMTLVHHFHHARPEAHHAAHRQTQLDRALRALERGRAERIQVSRQRAENERDCHHSRPKPGHCHVHQLLCP